MQRERLNNLIAHKSVCDIEASDGVDVFPPICLIKQSSNPMTKEDLEWKADKLRSSGPK